MERRLIPTSSHYHQRLRRHKLCFMSTIGQSLSSAIYQNLIIRRTQGMPEQALLFILLLLLLLLECDA